MFYIRTFFFGFLLPLNIKKSIANIISLASVRPYASGSSLLLIVTKSLTDTPATQAITLSPSAEPNGSKVPISLNVAKWQRTDSSK